MPFLTAIFVPDVGTHGAHRWAHTVPALWRLHAVHPSREHLDWLASSRVHPVDPPFTHCRGVLPAFFLGFTKETFGVLLAFDDLLALFIPANVRERFGWLDCLFGPLHSPAPPCPAAKAATNRWRKITSRNSPRPSAPLRPNRLPRPSAWPPRRRSPPRRARKDSRRRASAFSAPAP